MPQEYIHRYQKTRRMSRYPLSLTLFSKSSIRMAWTVGDCACLSWSTAATPEPPTNPTRAAEGLWIFTMRTKSCSISRLYVVILNDKYSVNESTPDASCLAEKWSDLRALESSPRPQCNLRPFILVATNHRCTEDLSDQQGTFHIFSHGRAGITGRIDQIYIYRCHKSVGLCILFGIFPRSFCVNCSRLR
jgi:hypothetical protein